MGLLNYTTAKINELLAKVAALPAKVMDGNTMIPSKTSDLTNDSKFVKETGLKTVNGHSLLGSGDITIQGGGGGTADSVDWNKVLNKPSWVNSSTKPEYTAVEIGALPSDTKIPAMTSDLENDSKFVKETGLKTINGQSIIGSGNIFIQSGSGEGGAGNVNVSNAAELVGGGQYVFTPSANGVSEGSFKKLNVADDINSGLMSADDHGKLKNFKEVLKLPLAVAGLSEASSSEDIESSLGASGNTNFIPYLAAAFSSIHTSEYEESLPDIYIGNHKCFVDASLETGKCSLALTYVASGKMRTVKINGTDNDSAWTFSCEIIKSGDDTYYLSHPDSYTATGCFTAFGGDEGRAKITLAVGQRKKFYIMYGSGVLGGSIPVTVESGFNIPVLIWTSPILEKTFRFYMLNETDSKLRVLDLYYYQLNSEFYSLTSSSTTDEISVAVGGEAGLKNIVQAVKDGNRIRINTTLSPYDVSTDLLPWVAGISKEGNIHLGVYGKGYGLFNSAGGLLVIDYTKTTNTFKAELLDV